MGGRGAKIKKVKNKRIGDKIKIAMNNSNSNFGKK